MTVEEQRAMRRAVLEAGHRAGIPSDRLEVELEHERSCAGALELLRCECDPLGFRIRTRRGVTRGEWRRGSALEQVRASAARDPRAGLARR